MRLFGITEKTAMRYVTAAHPERTAKLRTRAILRLAMHRTGRRELPGKPSRPQH